MPASDSQETTEMPAVKAPVISLYAESIQAIEIYVKHLNAAEQETSLLGDDVPYPKRVELTDQYGTDFGTLVDELGGTWSWIPPTMKTE